VFRCPTYFIGCLKVAPPYQLKKLVGYLYFRAHLVT
jgi:hypothetical protein